MITDVNIYSMEDIFKQTHRILDFLTNQEKERMFEKPYF
jgi:hypothetical protein